MNKMRIALRYCGGCNPMFDRSGLVSRLQKSLPTVELEPFCPERKYAASLVVCGCTAQCARVDDLLFPRFVLKNEITFDDCLAYLCGINSSDF